MSSPFHNRKLQEQVRGKVLDSHDFLCKKTSTARGGSGGLLGYIRDYLDDIRKVQLSRAFPTAAGLRMNYLVKARKGSNKIHSRGFLKNDIAKSSKQDSGELSNYQTIRHAYKAVKRRQKKRSKKVAHKFVFSIRPSLTRILYLATDSDKFILAMVDKVFALYAKKFYHGDSIGYLMGIHHDREHLHVHVLLLASTEKGKSLNVSHASPVQLTAGTRRIDHQGYLKAAAAVVVKDAYLRLIATPLLASVSQADRETFPIYKCCPEYFKSLEQKDIVPIVPSLDQLESAIVMPEPATSGDRRYFHKIWPLPEDVKFSNDQRELKLRQDLKDLAKFRAMIYACQQSGQLGRINGSDCQEWFDRRAAGEDSVGMLFRRVRQNAPAISKKLAALSPEGQTFRQAFDTRFKGYLKILDNLEKDTNVTLKNLLNPVVKPKAVKTLPLFPVPFVTLPATSVPSASPVVKSDESADMGTPVSRTEPLQDEIDPQSQLDTSDMDEDYEGFDYNILKLPGIGEPAKTFIPELPFLPKPGESVEKVFIPELPKLPEPDHPPVEISDWGG